MQFSFGNNPTERFNKVKDFLTSCLCANIQPNRNQVPNEGLTLLSILWKNIFENLQIPDTENRLTRTSKNQYLVQLWPKKFKLIALNRNKKKICINLLF